MGSWRATAGDGRECELELPGVPSSLAGAESVEYRTTPRPARPGRRHRGSHTTKAVRTDNSRPAKTTRGQRAGRTRYPGWRYETPDDIEWLLARYPAEILAAYGAPAPAGNPEDRTDATPVVTRPIAGVDDPRAVRAAQAGLLGRVTERLRHECVGAVACCLRDAGEAGFGVYE